MSRVVRVRRRSGEKKLKTVIKRIIKALARFPPLSYWLQRPGVHQWIQKVPVARLLVETGWNREHPFDRANGIDTSGMVPVSDLSLSEAASAHAVCYGGSQPSIVRHSLAVLPPLDTFNFVDLGCGKGRALVVASEFPFTDIVGVELSSALVGVARANAKIISRNFPSRTSIRVVECDAANYQLPAGDLVLYLYNPFGEPVVARVVQALEAAIASQRLRRVYVVYYNPVAGHCFDASPALCRHSAFEVRYAQEELGFGPDESDAVVIWQDLRQPVPQVPAKARIVLHPSGTRVSLVEA